MGTYTTNYNLFMPSVGEQGWGDLVNGNFTTIDTAMKGLDTRTETLETEMDAVEERITTLEAGNFETITVNDIQINGELTQTVRTIKVSPSEYYSSCKGGFCILTYIPSVRYTGTLKSYGDMYSAMPLYCYDSNFNITVVSVSHGYGSGDSASTAKTLSIPADTVMVYTAPGSYYSTSISLPLFSE